MDNQKTTALAKRQAPDSADGLVRDILSDLRQAATLRYKERLAARLESLLDAFKEDTGGKAFSANSLRGFLQFLETYSLLKFPTVTITPDGDIYASWKEGRDKVFSVQFLETKQVRFVVLRPSDGNVGQPDQLSGVISLDTLMAVLVPLGVLEWAAE